MSIPTLAPGVSRPALLPMRRSRSDAGRFAARSHTRFETIAAVWRYMEANGFCAVYQSSDWAAGIVAHLAKASAAPLLIEIADANGRPVMILPMAVMRRRGLRVVTWLDLGVADYAAPLVAEGFVPCAETMDEVWRAVRAVLPAADLIQIERIPAELHGQPNPLTLAPGRRRMAMQASGVAIDGDPDTLVRRLCRPSTVKDFGKQRRRLERAGSVAFEQMKTPDEVEALFTVLLAQRRQRFGEMGRFDLLARPDVAAFYREQAQAGLAGGSARLFRFSVGADVVGAIYGLVHRGAFNGLLLTTSSDERWRNASPGMQLICEALGWARRDGITYFDFTVGDLPYKRDFGVTLRDLDELVQPLTLRGSLSLAVARASEAMFLELKRHPAAFERVQRLRRGVRRVWR